MIPFHVPNIGSAAKVAAAATLESGWVTAGAKTEELERRLADMHGRRFCVAVNSCTSGMDLIFRFLSGEVRPLRVAFPAVNFAGPVGMALSLNAEVELIDVEAHTGQCSLSQLTHAWRRNDVIVPMPYGGGYSFRGMDDLCRTAQGAGKIVVEDAAHALGGKYESYGGLIGSVQTFATVFSFYATKIVTGIEGGAVLTDDEELAEYLKKARLHGIPSTVYGRSRDPSKGFMYECEILGRKYAPNDLSSAMVLEGLDGLEDTLNRARDIAQRYAEEVRGLEARYNSMSASPMATAGNNHLCPILIKKGCRDEFMEHAVRNGVQCSVHYPPLWKMRAFKRRVKRGYLAEAEVFSKRVVSLPVYNAMTDEDVEKVCTMLRDF